nr:La protein 7 [Hymenolepis microstoma]
MPRRNTSIHIKNLADGVRHEELRHAFGKFGRVVDVTVPVNYHTGRPKGFAFCTFEDPRDAEDAVYHMNKTRFAGREISVEFTRGTRKTPAEMRARDSGSRSGRSWRSRSRSRTPRRRRSSRDRSVSRDRRRRRDDYRRHSFSRSPEEENGRNGRRRNSVDDRHSRSPSAGRSPSRGDASRSPSPRGSDANLSHDGFFFAELKRSPDESIGFDLLLRCNKLRALGATTKEHLVLALERSKSLKINDLGFHFPMLAHFMIFFGTESLAVTSFFSFKPFKNYEALEVGVELRESLAKNLHFTAADFMKFLGFKTSGSLRGFAFVEFGSKNAADSALAAFAPTEEDLVRTPPIPTSIKGKKMARESGWMPKTAPYATSSLSLSEQLARQMVWRCCSRRSKQERAAFRRLLHAGYRRPNPLDAEYYLITEGYTTSTNPAEFGKVTEERKERLRLLPYSDWELWRARFYQWQRAWVTRMNAKAEKLSAQAERKMRAVNVSSSRNRPKVTSPSHSEANGSPPSVRLDLPSSYSPGTVVEVFWPVETEVMNQDLRKQMRHVRLAIESSVLQPHNLLHSVMHFDTQSGNRLPPLRRPQHLSSALVEPNHTVCVYIRFKEPQEAKAFVSAIAEPASGSSQDSGDAEGTWRRRGGCLADILEGEREEEYCAAIAASKAGAAERRRRTQAAKRRKKVKSQKATASL